MIEQLDQPPILIGHSLGGVVVQKLLERGYGRAAVCINSGPPKGIFALNWPFLISNAQLVNPFKHDPIVLMNAKWYHRYVTNELSMTETQAFIEKNFLPASKRVAQTSESIDFHKPHPPLLFIAGDQDRSQPVVINQKNAQAYIDEHSVTDFKAFTGRTHNVLAQPGWQTVAQYILNWVPKQA